MNAPKTRAEFVALSGNCLDSARQYLNDDQDAASLVAATMAVAYSNLANAAPAEPQQPSARPMRLIQAASDALRYFETDAEGVHPEKVVTELRAAIAESMSQPKPQQDVNAELLAVMKASADRIKLHAQSHMDDTGRQTCEQIASALLAAILRAESGYGGNTE